MVDLRKHVNYVWPIWNVKQVNFLILPSQIPVLLLCREKQCGQITLPYDLFASSKDCWLNALTTWLQNSKVLHAFIHTCVHEYMYARMRVCCAWACVHSVDFLISIYQTVLLSVIAYRISVNPTASTQIQNVFKSWYEKSQLEGSQLTKRSNDRFQTDELVLCSWTTFARLPGKCRPGQPLGRAFPDRLHCFWLDIALHSQRPGAGHRPNILKVSSIIQRDSLRMCGAELAKDVSRGETCAKCVNK